MCTLNAFLTKFLHRISCFAEAFRGTRCTTVAHMQCLRRSVLTMFREHVTQACILLQVGSNALAWNILRPCPEEDGNTRYASRCTNGNLLKAQCADLDLESTTAQCPRKRVLEDWPHGSSCMQEKGSGIHASIAIQKLASLIVSFQIPRRAESVVLEADQIFHKCNQLTTPGPIENQQFEKCREPKRDQLPGSKQMSSRRCNHAPNAMALKDDVKPIQCTVSHPTHPHQYIIPYLSFLNCKHRSLSSQSPTKLDTNANSAQTS